MQFVTELLPYMHFRNTRIIKKKTWKKQHSLGHVFVWWVCLRSTCFQHAVACSYSIWYPPPFWWLLIMGRGECRLCLLRIHRHTPQGFGGFILTYVYFKTPVDTVNNMELLYYAIDWGLSQFIVGIPINQLDRGTTDVFFVAKGKYLKGTCFGFTLLKLPHDMLWLAWITTFFSGKPQALVRSILYFGGQIPTMSGLKISLLFLSHPICWCSSIFVP